MTRDEKIQAIEEMGVSIELDCPEDKGINGRFCGSDCASCWIESLENNKVNKLRYLKDMGINVEEECPTEFGLQEYCGGGSCQDCWIKSLEDGGNND